MAGRSAIGGLASARSASPTNQYIGCYAQISTGPVYWGYCEANDGQGTSAMCTTSDVNFVTALRSLTTDGWGELPVGRQRELHTLIATESFSYLAPKVL